jgi:hypothetical protein
MLLALDLIDSLDTDTNLERRCRGLYSTMFSPDAAVVQITASFRDIVFVA